MNRKLIAIAAVLCLLVVAGAATYGLLGNGTLATSIDVASTQSSMVADIPIAAEPAPVEAPVVEQPAAANEAPAAEEPAVVNEAPAAEEPAAVNEAPAAEEPAVVNEAPAVEEPAVVNEEPSADEPVVDEPAVDTPAEDEPTTDEPVVDEPAVDTPVEDEPTTDESVVDEPAVDTPVEDKPTTDEPVVDEPAVDTPVENEPTTDEPVVDEPAVDTPVEDEPTTEEPVVDDPAVDTPAEDEPTTDEPVVDDPAVDVPSVEDPSVDEENSDIIVVAPLAAHVLGSAEFVNVGDIFNVNVSVSGGVMPYQSVTNVVLDGVVMNSTNQELVENATLVVSYQPMQAGTYTITMDVVDAAGNTASSSIQIGARDRSTGIKNDAKWQELAKAIELTGDWRMDVLLIAQSQLGNVESDVDFIVENEQTSGYTLYGEWVGNAYTDWCAAFIGWCFEQAETGMPLRLAAVSDWVDQMKAYNAFREIEGYVPQAGDIIFLIPNEQTEIGHIGLVEYVTADVIGTIEANVGNMVDRRTYQLDDVAIGGYASMVALMEAANIEHAEEAVLPYEVVDVADFTAYLNTDDTVNLRNGPSTATMRKATLSGVGTPVLVTAQVEVDGVLWYLIECEDIYGQQTGYMMAKFLDGTAPAPEDEDYNLNLDVEEDEGDEEASAAVEEEIPVETEAAVEEEISAETETAVEEEIPAETEAAVEEEIPAETETAVEEEIPAEDEPAFVEFTVEEDPVITIVDTVTREVVTNEGVPADITEWASAVNADETMIQRAMNAPSLDSLVIEGDALIYVRTGEKMASFNAETGELIDDELNVVVAIVDMESGMVYPVSNANTDAE